MAESDGLLGLKVDDVLEVIASESRGPAAGSAAALVVALAAALTAKVARLSRADWEEAGGAVAQAETLRLRVAPLAQADAEAHAAALGELRPVSATGAGQRDERLGATLAEAAAAPLRIAEAGADVAELAAVAAEHADPDVRADAIGAALLAEAGTRAAAILVDVNLATTETDPRVARARALAAQAGRSAQRALVLTI